MLGNSLKKKLPATGSKEQMIWLVVKANSPSLVHTCGIIWGGWNFKDP